MDVAYYRNQTNNAKHVKVREFVVEVAVAKHVKVTADIPVRLVMDLALVHHVTRLVRGCVIRALAPAEHQRNVRLIAQHAVVRGSVDVVCVMAQVRAALDRIA